MIVAFWAAYDIEIDTVNCANFILFFLDTQGNWLLDQNEYRANLPYFDLGHRPVYVLSHRIFSLSNTTVEHILSIRKSNMKQQNMLDFF